MKNTWDEVISDQLHEIETNIGGVSATIEDLTKEVQGLKQETALATDQLCKIAGALISYLVDKEGIPIDEVNDRIAEEGVELYSKRKGDGPIAAPLPLSQIDLPETEISGLLARLERHINDQQDDMF